MASGEKYPTVELTHSDICLLLQLVRDYVEPKNVTGLTPETMTLVHALCLKAEMIEPGLTTLRIPR